MIEKCNIYTNYVVTFEKRLGEDYFFPGTAGLFAPVFFAAAGGMYWTTSL